MAGNLPDLCLQNIFKHLNEDYKALYSCSLVNKPWSYSSIPVLWANPFELIYAKESKYLKLLTPLLDTYVSFLPQNQQEALKIQPKFDQNSIMFNYPVYFRRMNLFLILDSIVIWREKEFKDDTILVYKALIEYFFNHSFRIDTIAIYSNSPLNILDVSGSAKALSRIHTLTIDDNLFPSLSNFNQYFTSLENLFSTLSNLNQNIKSFSFHILNDTTNLNSSLKQLIRSQKSLFDVTIEGLSRAHRLDTFPIYWEIFHSSKNVTSTITFMEFKDVRFPKDVPLLYHLSLFTNLQYLKFNQCDTFCMTPNIKEDQLLQEINSNYPLAFKKLNTIIIIGFPLNLDLLKIFLQLSGEELRCFELLDMNIAKFNYIIKWLEVFCFNLRRLVVVDKSNENLEIVGIRDFLRKFNNLSYGRINGNRIV